jgi:hypothetical protein
MRLTLDPLRTSLLAALGLLACNPTRPGEDESSSDPDTTAGTTTDTSATSNPGTTEGPATSEPVTTSATATEPGTTSSATEPSSESDPATSEPPGTETGTETGSPVTCEGVLEVFPQGNTKDVPSGFVACDGGIIHREEKQSCDVPATPSSCTDNSGGGPCTTDADCTDKPHGTCQQDMIFGGILPIGDTCSCVYGCESDADCAAGEICRCGGDSLGLYTQCIAAECTVDGDCPDGEVCGLSPDICAPGGFLLACTTPQDTCSGNGDCGAPPCSFNLDHWECSNAACGRPFVVEHAAVTAAPAPRDDWRALLAAPAPVDAATAERLAAHWSKIGLLEHASVAAFAQFVLQLLGVGAPPELVLAAQQALADEVEHARLAFALASAYQRAGVGPGPLPLAGDAAPADLASLLDAVIREACLGETLAAFEAREAAAQAADPAVRAALRRIADDELRHAELGWRFVQWAVGADPSLAAQARATFAAAVAEARRGALRDGAAPGAPELRAHGVIDEPLRAEIWTRGLADVIVPCAATLLAPRLAA